MNQERFKKLVSGQSTGVIASALRLVLNVAAVFYGLGVSLRNWLYDGGQAKSHAVTAAGLVTSDRTQATVPVISIGNITVGGTGKTPLVVWLCNLFREQDVNCAILTRGYKAAKGESDEPGMLAKNCPGTAVVVNPDRLAGAIEAVKKYRAQVLIMDDGFQHRRLHRDIDIVTIDAMQPFGYGRLLPAGLLREPVSALKRAKAVILTRCDLVSKNNLTELTAAIKKINPNVIITQTIHSPVFAVSSEKQIPLEELKNKKIYAFCGIANPEAFLATVGLVGANIVGYKIYDDHYNYTVNDVNDIYRDAAKSGAQMILTTEKDYNKVLQPASGAGELVLAYLAVRLQFVDGADRIMELIERSLAGKIPRKRTV
ncbi:MAG: tetraacyldisaccharide 4'-kinase [Sedimentisphaerales bacterium]|jgi:tetraacyldisaccharide 4'-kinase